MSNEVKNNVTNEQAEERAFKIKVTEKATFPSTLNIAPMKLSDLAASLNGIFTPYKDFLGTEFKVDIVNGIQVLNFSACFLVGHQGDGVTTAFAPVDDEVKDDSTINRMIKREKAFSTGRKTRLTKDGENGIADFILPHFQKKWKNSNIQEIVERDRFGNASKVYVKVSGIDYNACIREIWGNKIEATDGEHKAIYTIQLKKMLTGTPVNTTMGQQTYAQDWLIELIQGDTNAMNEFYREIGVFMNPNSPALNIVPR